MELPIEENRILTASAKTILLVEDEAEVRKVVGLTLKLHGYQVLGSSSALEALEIARASDLPIDLLLTDVVMPDLSGPELAAAIKGFMPSLRVLYMSGYADDLLQTHGLSCNDCEFLAKPFSSTALSDKVREVLSKPDE